MRWFHEGVDCLHIALVYRLFPRVFRRGAWASSLHEHLAAVRVLMPALTTSQRLRVPIQTRVGELDAGIRIRFGPRPALPVLVYHHGIAEVPADKSFRGIFRTPSFVQTHLVALQAPYHRSYYDCAQGLASLEHFVAMCAASIGLMEAVRQAMAAYGAQGSLIVGTSLGGFLALMHHLAFGTADGYVPLLAGPDLAHVMLTTAYRRLVAPEALLQPAQIEALFDFRLAFQASAPSRVLPLLARYDRCMIYAHHQACYAASGVPVATIERGHITGACAFATLRAHVLACLAHLCPPAP